MTSDDFLLHRKRETLIIINSVKTEFEIMTSARLNTKPAPGKWSASECFQHLNLSLEIYIPQMNKLITQKEKFPQDTDSFKLSIIGKIAVKTMTPKADDTLPLQNENIWKVKTDAIQH